MFVGRKVQCDQLQTTYEQEVSGVTILYGRVGMGKTTLVREFTKDKPFVYYLGREYSKAEQKKHLEPVLDKVREYVSEEEDKICVVIDEFHLIWRSYKDFFEELNESFNEVEKSHMMLILISSSIQWVENEMVGTMGSFATSITGFVKLKEFTFLDMVNRFPKMETEQIIAAYGILGGVPAYLNLWDPNKSIRDNVIALFLQEQSPLFMEPNRILKLDLRELSVYNTILAVLAEDEYKLNYLYNRTGFSRAKISVYIKNLIQLDVAAKIFSFEPEKRENIQKGLYGITDSLLYFYYKFIFPNLSDAAFMDSKEFYERYIAPGFDDYMRLSFIKVCREFLDLMNQYGKLDMNYETIGSLYGKEGFIPLIAKDEEGRLLVGTCKWSESPMNFSEFEELLKYMEQTGKEADYYFLFSKEGFTSDLAGATAGLDNVTLIDKEQL